MRPAILLLVFLTFLISSCVSHHAVLALPETTIANLKTREVMVATSRQRDLDPAILFGRNRSTQLSFMDADISLPPEREAGQLPKPTGKADPRKQFAVIDMHIDAGEEEFVRRLNANLEKLPPEDRNVFIFVHGYNVGFADGLYRTVQLAEDFRFPGLAVHYSWPSAASTPLYLYDRDSASFARDGLVRTLQLVEGSKARSVLLVGHSMGTSVVMESLRDISRSRNPAMLERLEAVVLASPDIDTDVFFSQLDAVDPRPDPFVIFVSSRDRALQVSQRIRGGHARIGEGTDIDRLRAEGITVIDLSKIKDGARGNHSTFASSPTVIRMAESGALSTASLIGQPVRPDPLAEGIGQLSDLASSIIYLPAQVVGAR